MGKGNCLLFITIMSFHLFLPLLCLHLVVVGSELEAVPNSSPKQLPRCHEDEAAALVEFRDSLTFSEYCKDNRDPKYVDRKMELWKIEGNCCTWGGIECDVRNGHVISLDLSQSCLYGSINSSSSLFHLVHLQKLNLAYNRFELSEMPAAIGNFSWLTSLNLSGCAFIGQFPPKLFSLTNMSSLDLYGNYELKLNLENLARSLTKLEELYLSHVNISSPVPSAVANLSNLSFLTMSSCKLQGEFPSTIFNLPNLQLLDISYNEELSGHLPEFKSSRPLKRLSLFSTNFSGELPNSLGNLWSLIDLDLSFCHFKGFMPSSIGNLTKLTTVDLHHNEFQGPLPSSFGNLTHLAYFDLSYNQLTGQIPSSFGNLFNLEHLDLNFNQLSGEIPSSLGDGLANLKFLGLKSNQLGGQIPPQFSNLPHLTDLELSSNKLTGTVQLDMFSGLKNLSVLLLSYNNLSVITNTKNVTLSLSGRLSVLALASCKLREFPILQDPENLFGLDLSDNDIHGQIPAWVLSSQELNYLNLSHNFLTSFWQDPVILKNVETLDLSFNELRGSPPLPLDLETVYYIISNNRISGDISPLICNTSQIQFLDLSNNNFTGTIPQCVGNLTGSIQLLSLHDNSFYGRIPDTLEGRCDGLQMADLSNNQFDGQLPRSLSSCTKLEFLNLGNNMISDTFPSWLGSLDALRVLILRSNKLHGTIEEPKAGLEFPGLHIIDVSQNDFNGYLPSKYFQTWNYTINTQGYLEKLQEFVFAGMSQPYFYYTMMLTNKGVNMEYLKILDYFRAIDFSSNNFNGLIPTSVADIKGLHLLNLSNNHLIGPIPPSLGDLTDLQALDMSKNSLSGYIPQQLEQLTFLEFFNVSGNNLSGSIPRGKQFSTFQNDSYEGNEGLCGDPLSRKCGISLQPPPSEENELEDLENPFYIEWKAVVVGYASSFIIAALIGHCIITVRQNWFVVIFQLREQRRSRQER